MSVQLSGVNNFNTETLRPLFNRVLDMAGTAFSSGSQANAEALFFQDWAKIDGRRSTFQNLWANSSPALSSFWNNSLPDALNPYKMRDFSPMARQQVGLFTLGGLVVVATVAVGLGLLFCGGSGCGPSIEERLSIGGGTGGGEEDSGTTGGEDYSDMDEGVTGADTTEGTEYSGECIEEDGVFVLDCPIDQLDHPCWDLDSESPDGDGLINRLEDLNQDGVLDEGETNPCNHDTDGDAIIDGIEDQNQNGICDPEESCAYLPDTDFDGLIDSDEDCDLNGQFDPEDAESQTYNPDTDSDGINDFEDACPLNPDTECLGEGQCA